MLRFLAENLLSEKRGIARAINIRFIRKYASRVYERYRYVRKYESWERDRKEDRENLEQGPRNTMSTDRYVRKRQTGHVISCRVKPLSIIRENYKRPRRKLRSRNKGFIFLKCLYDIYAISSYFQVNKNFERCIKR